MVTDNTYKHIWKVAYPIIIGLVAQNLMVVIDTAFLGRLGEVTLGASAIGGIFFLSLVMLGAGFSVGTQIMIGRRNGEQRFRNIGRLFDHAIYFLLLLAILVFLLLTYVAPAFLDWFLSSDAVSEESLIFIKYRRYGIFFGFLNLGFHAFYVGITRTMLLSVSTTIMAVVNIVLDYALIFGHFGLPEMGIAGAAIATNIAEFVTFIFFVAYTWRSHNMRIYKLFRFWKPHQRLYRPLFKLAIPVMFQFFLSFAAWFVFFMIIEKIGETALAASNITRSVYMLLMIPVWGLSSATNTLVSNTIGRGNSQDVLPLIWKIVLISVVSNLIMIQPAIFFPHEIASLFTTDQHLIEATVPLLRVISLALIVFSITMIIFNGLSGTGKTMIALRIELFSIGLYLITAFVLATVFKAQAEVVWFVEVVYFGIMGLLAFLSLKKGKWKEI